MRDFIRFSHQLWSAVWFLRGVILSLFAILIICALGISWAENMLFRDALYFIFITALTVGYGDIIPKTGIGRLISVIAGIHGILITGIVIAVATRALQRAYAEKIEAHKALHEDDS